MARLVSDDVHAIRRANGDVHFGEDRLDLYYLRSRDSSVEIQPFRFAILLDQCQIGHDLEAMPDRIVIPRGPVHTVLSAVGVHCAFAFEDRHEHIKA